MIKRRIFEPEHDLFRQAAADWADRELLPHMEEWHEAGIVSADAWKSAGDQGFLCMWADEKYGGMGVDDFRFDQILVEELAPRSPGFFLPLHNRIVGPYFQKFCTDEQKTHFMPQIVSGDSILAIAMTEPDAGSDLAGMRSMAVQDGDDWVLNGSKTYISNGHLAGLYVVAARTSRDNPHAMGLFVVEADMEGFRRGRNLKKMGLKPQDTAEIFFTDVRIPKSHVLGDPSQGFRNMMVGLAEERLIGACGYVTSAQRAFDITMKFILERKVFGRPVGTFQNSRFKMAEMKTEIDACWTYVDHCVQEHLEGNLTAEMAAQVKLFASEVEGRVVDECVQLHGGAGYMDEYEISRLYTNARISRIYAGTSEIMKEIIGRGLGLDDRRKKA